MLALAATSKSSAVFISGRRSSSADGKPAGMLGGEYCSVSAVPRGIGPGLRPSSKLIWFSWMAIWRSSSGIVEPVRERLEMAESSSSLLEAPPVSRVW